LKKPEQHAHSLCCSYCCCWHSHCWSWSSTRCCCRSPYYSNSWPNKQM